MKLYTEEQVRVMLDLSKLNIYGTKIYSKDELIEQQKPIELPSDEDIEIASNVSLLYPTDKSANFRIGAKWMKVQILNQKK